MLMFPLEFMPVKYPGYVWNVKEQQLYTYKLGILRKLPTKRPNPWNHARGPFYNVSHQGARRRLYVDALQKMSLGYEVHTVLVATPQQARLFD